MPKKPNRSSSSCRKSWAGFDAIIAASCLAVLVYQEPVAASTSILETRNKFLTADTVLSTSWRGGASKKQRRKSDSNEDPFILVARAIQDRLAFEMEEPTPPQISDIVDAFGLLSSSQQTFKGLDGAAHEAYQRTHAGDDVDLSVRGRARRSAARAAATANGLGACELCELLETPLTDSSSINGTLAGGRQVLLNVTASESSILLDGSNKVSLVVLYEPVYNGGAGILHGGIDEEGQDPPKRTQKGRLLVIVGDELRQDLTRSLKVLDSPPKHVKLSAGLLSNEVASVQSSLYKAAGSLLENIEPTFREYENKTAAIHFVGRSLAGGVANLAAIILDGSLPMPKKGSKGKQRDSKSKKKRAKKESSVGLAEDGYSDVSSLNATEAGNTTTIAIVPLSGLGKDRTSSVSLGAPPCVSANVQTEFIISIMYGDDVVCRATRASLDRLLKRSKKALNSKGWLGGKQLNFMTDALSLTVSSLKSHAHGSEGEELRLAVPGRAYLLRPRRLGGFCSIHEVGNRLKGGREALRAHVLWQLDDILLSKSLWKHHQLDSYIHGLDRAHLRGFTEEEGDDE